MNKCRSKRHDKKLIIFAGRRWWKCLHTFASLVWTQVCEHVRMWKKWVGERIMIYRCSVFVYKHIHALRKSAGDGTIIKGNLVSSNACRSMRLYGINAPRLDPMLKIICWHQLIKCGGAGEVIQRHIPSSSFWLITYRCATLPPWSLSLITHRQRDGGNYAEHVHLQFWS